MKKLRMTYRSALLLAQRRLWEEQRRAALFEGMAGQEVRDTAPASDPAKIYTLWIFTGLIVLGTLAVGADYSCFPDVNVPFLLASAAAVAGGSLHVYTFEVWVWPRLRKEGFPATPFGGPGVTRGFYRVAWHSFTVSWLATGALLLFFAFRDFLPYTDRIVLLLCVYWTGIVISIFFVTALSLHPGQSFIRTMAKAFQWMIALVMVGLMYWGTTR